jgi:hypothetical protein
MIEIANAKKYKSKTTKIFGGKIKSTVYRKSQTVYHTRSQSEFFMHIIVKQRSNN